LGTPIAKDENGREVHPVIRLYTLGVHRLKELELERLAVNDGGPGQWYIADGISRRHLEEFFGERLVAGRFERHGDNETLDLAGYCEAARLMLQPDRKDIVWNDPARRPVWARPVSLFSEGGDPTPPGGADASPEPKTKTRLRRFDALNQRKD
jgi:phage terminase large subunit GpA-like protein